MSIQPYGSTPYYPQNDETELRKPDQKALKKKNIKSDGDPPKVAQKGMVPTKGLDGLYW